MFHLGAHAIAVNTISAIRDYNEALRFSRRYESDEVECEYCGTKHTKDECVSCGASSAEARKKAKDARIVEVPVWAGCLTMDSASLHHLEPTEINEPAARRAWVIGINGGFGLCCFAGAAVLVGLIFIALGS